MNKDKTKYASISSTLTHGTARQVFYPSIIPITKSEKELFWTQFLLGKLNPKYKYVNIASNPDDSNGNHDVIITLQDKSTIGVQVTEFTYELERTRQHIKEDYTVRIFNEIQSRKIISKKRIIVCIKFPFTETRKPISEKPERIVNVIEKLVAEEVEDGCYKFEFGNILFQTLNQEICYLPNINNIGIDVNFDKLPRSLDMYCDCVDAIFHKKGKSKSNWLLIWSMEFWKDRHWLEQELIDYMKRVFENSNFEKVYFAESMDGENIFQVNFKFDEIK